MTISSTSADVSDLGDELKEHILKIVKALGPKVASETPPQDSEDIRSVVHGSFDGLAYTLDIRARPWKLAERYNFSNVEDAKAFTGSPLKWTVEFEPVVAED